MIGMIKRLCLHKNCLRVPHGC